MPELLSRKNLLLSDMQRVIIINISKITLRPAGPVLTFDNHKVCSATNRDSINRVTLQRKREFILFRFYFPLFMVLLRVIFRSV